LGGNKQPKLTQYFTWFGVELTLNLLATTTAGARINP